MLRIIVLHKLVTIWPGVSDKRYQCCVKDVCVKSLFHYAFKNTNATPPFQADACPNVYLGGMLVPEGEGLGGGRRW